MEGERHTHWEVEGDGDAVGDVEADGDVDAVGDAARRSGVADNPTLAAKRVAMHQCRLSYRWRRAARRTRLRCAAGLPPCHTMRTTRQDVGRPGACASNTTTPNHATLTQKDAEGGGGSSGVAMTVRVRGGEEGGGRRERLAAQGTPEREADGLGAEKDGSERAIGKPTVPVLPLHFLPSPFPTHDLK